MVKLFRPQKRFVEINLAPKKGWEFSIFLTNIYPKFKSRNYLLFLVSFISFLGIFIEDYIANIVLNQKRNEINQLRKTLIYQDIKIKKLKKDLQLAEQKFKNFYIPNLKEKIFYIWYYQHGLKRLWKTVDKFTEIVKGKTEFVGFRIFPSPYNKLSDNIIFEREKVDHQTIYKSLEENFFAKNKTLLDENSFTIYVNSFELDKDFARNMAKIKDKTIKANLLLEYGLLTGRIKSEYIKIPITIMFPFNLSFESEENLNQTLNMLKSFCNILQISSFLNTKIYTVSGKKVRAIIDGVCIKRIF